MNIEHTGICPHCPHQLHDVVCDCGCEFMTLDGGILPHRGCGGVAVAKTKTAYSPYVIECLGCGYITEEGYLTAIKAQWNAENVLTGASPSEQTATANTEDGR